MQDDEPEERARLADRPWFPSARPVVLVERLDDDGVDDRDINRDLDIEPCRVDVLGDRKRRMGERGRRDGRGFVCWGIVEECRRREREPDGGVVHHGGRLLVEEQYGEKTVLDVDAQYNLAFPDKSSQKSHSNFPNDRIRLINPGVACFHYPDGLPRGGLVPQGHAWLRQ